MMGSLVLLAQLVECLRWYSNTSKALWCTLEARDFEKVKDTVRNCGEPQVSRYKTGSRLSWDVEDLKRIVPESSSYAEVLKKLGLTTRAGNYGTIKKYIALHSLDTSHFTGQAWVGTRDYQPTERQPIEEILVENSTYGTHNLRIRLLKEGIFLPICSSCTSEEWMGVPIPLELDHINGVRTDHRIHNLRLLCPNCHALTPTWRGRNRKSSVV